VTDDNSCCDAAAPLKVLRQALWWRGAPACLCLGLQICPRYARCTVNPGSYASLLATHCIGLLLLPADATDSTSSSAAALACSPSEALPPCRPAPRLLLSIHAAAPLLATLAPACWWPRSEYAAPPWLRCECSERCVEAGL
jgi:hypothetical protein